MRVNIELLKDEKTPVWTSSKGNQNKWCADGVWYKEDGLGYEALAEVFVSRLLEKTNIDHYVVYEYEWLEKHGRMCRGCRSNNFMLPEDDKVISVDRLFQIYYGESAAKAVLKFPELTDRIQYVVDSVEKATGLEDFGIYLKKMITLDALFLNEDRHFHNIAVIQKKDGTYRECPIFDHGAALFSDVTEDYPLHMSAEDCYQTIQAKPFSTDFDSQLDACDVLFGGFRFQAKFTAKDVEQILAEFQGIYEDEILYRIRETMRIQMRKYSYLFCAS